MTSALEDIKSIDLEEWLTLATAPAPTKLKQGQSPDMQNVWTDEKPGSVITAPAYIKVGVIPSNNPVTFCINYFKTSSGVQTFVVSDNSTVWTTVDFQTFTSIITGLSSAFQLRGAVIRDKLWMTNGSDPVQVFDGSSVTALSNAAYPRGRFIAYHDERVWLYHVSATRSAVYFSSLTDASANIIQPDDVNAWDMTDNFLQISEGDADFGTGMILYRGYLFFFKQYSIWRLVGYDEYTYSRVKTRASTGTRFNESVQILDSLVHLIGVDGIYVFDGEESVRISDIIDPATASQTAFGFNQIQQPNTNNQFWEVGQTADWNAGTVPTNLVIDNAASLIAADDSQADFQAGVVQTNLDLTRSPGSILLDHTGSGVSAPNVASGATPALIAVLGGQQIGTPDNLCNGGASYFGCAGGSIEFKITFSKTFGLTRIIIRGIQSNSDILIRFATTDPTTGIQVPVSASLGGAYGNEWDIQGAYLANPTDVTFVFNAFSATTLYMTLQVVTPGRSAAFSHFEAYESAYYTTGKFTSKTLDLGITPTSLGVFNATEILNGEGTSYFTQSSIDGVVWDSEVSCTNGGAIASVPKRYIRWGVNLTSDGLNTPQIDAAFLPSVYLSAIHDTGGSIYGWGPIESNPSLAGQTVSYYYRGATSSGGVTAASWNLIVPGGVLNFSTSFRYIQFKFEISGGSADNLPVVPSVTINWVIGSAGQPQTLQNVASAYWRNRYWLSAAGPSATSNDTILVRGKKTFNSPWMLKDWNILSFTRYFDSLYGGSSVDGSVYKLDTGYSKNGAAVDSYFETHDFTFGGFTCQLIELLVEAERSGPWDLNIGVSVDAGKTFDTYLMDLTPSSYDNEYIKRINVSYTTTRFRLRFGTNGVDTPFQVHRCVAFYKLQGTRGSIKGDYM
jgi:hypothetical protein